MTPFVPQDESVGEDARPPRRGSPHGVRALAEWVSFGFSAAVVVALAGYLIYNGLRANGVIVPLEVWVALDEATQAEERFVVPVHVRNKGRRALKNVKVEVRHVTSDGTRANQEFEIDYLPEGSRDTTYLYLDRDPHNTKVEAKPLQYRLE